MTYGRFLTGLALGAVLLGVSATATASPARTLGSTRLPHTQQVTLVVTGTGAHQQVTPSNGNIAIAGGVPVRVTIVNYSSEYHTFTIPALDVSALIRPAHEGTPTRTSFTFTASKQGVFDWLCAFCAGGAHGRPHDMGGTVYAVINPSVLP